LTKAIEFDPNYHLSYFWRAMSYKRIDQNDLANKDFEKGVDIYPDKATAYMIVLPAIYSWAKKIMR
jgi:Tfp pilus assembly protein PilF